MDHRSISGTPAITGYNIYESYFTSSNMYFKSQEARFNHPSFLTLKIS